MKLSLGPVLYYWTREALLGFYANLPHSQLATIYLGEVVCGRRNAMRPADWLGLARDLAKAGVQVVLSTQVLIESDLDLRAVRQIAENGEFLVEANDMGAVRMLAGRTRFVAGPHLNVYNPTTLAWLAELGIAAVTRARAPGVYVDDAKIASLGLRIRRGRSYHGLAVNVAMDLAPFARINPCGYTGLRMTQVADLLPAAQVPELEIAQQGLLDQLARRLGYTGWDYLGDEGCGTAAPDGASDER